ncbi:MAG: DUF1269 domain-containing protein [Anaerolineae bacterium]|nr:DUF1269 domain-containing protein [Anaerolineae bacterium]
MIEHVRLLQKQQLISVSDAAFVIRQKDGGIKVKQANSLVGAGALGGAFWGLFIGQHFWLSWMPMGTETVTNRVDNQEVDSGIDEDFLKEVGAIIKPGYSALFMFVAYLTEEILVALDQPDVTLLYTNLSGEADVKLRKTFGIVEEV